MKRLEGDDRLKTAHSPLFVAKELFENRYQGADAIFVAGSVVRGEATSYSDLDLVVLFPKVKTAYRESFIHKDWPVEAFIHDRDTIRYFFQHVDRPIGRATLAEMISEGHEFPNATAATSEVKVLAEQAMREGPAALSDEEIQDRRYQISGLIDDLREPRSRQEMVASSAAVYHELADYYFRCRRSWSGSGKNLVKRMKKIDPAFARQFDEAFEALFLNSQPKLVIELAESIMSANGGPLFDGYRRESPMSWRKD
jgi:hypothetical protein